MENVIGIFKDKNARAWEMLYPMSSMIKAILDTGAEKDIPCRRGLVMGQMCLSLASAMEKRFSPNRVPARYVSPFTKKNLRWHPWFFSS
jgi:hypothetical protein